MKQFSKIGFSVAIFLVNLAAAFSDESAWTTRAPIQDTYIGSAAAEKGIPKGDATGLIVGNGREAFLMFDVSGLADVTTAKIRLHCTQCGTAEGVVYPLYCRVMRNDTWNESAMNWNMRPAEIGVYPSPILATDDPMLAGYVEIPSGSADSWIEVDVTKAVKAAAQRGRLAFHVYTYKDNAAGDQTPLAFASANNDDATLRPQLAFQGAADDSATSLTILPIADTFVRAGGNANTPQDGELILVDNSGREGFIKFDLSKIGLSSVNSAVLLLRMYSGEKQKDHTSDSTIQFKLMSNDSWTESGLTWNTASTYGVTPGAQWEADTPQNAIRSAGANTNCFYSIELAPLVNQILAAGGTTMSLHLSMPDSPQRYFIFYSKECEIEAWRPRLLLTPKVAQAVVSRTPIQETFVSDYTTGNMTKSFYNGNYSSYMQIGCDGSKVQYGLMLFDVSDLGDADFVRIRIANKREIAAGTGALRVAVWTTDAWNETNMTWNTVGPWFPQPVSVINDTPLNGETANIKLMQKKSAGTWFEADVTAAAHAAAAAGRMLTIGLFSNQNWPEFHKGASSSPAVLLFPDPDAEFGARVVASLDESGAEPALRLSWSPVTSDAGEYAVERSDDSGTTWRTVASGLSEPTCLDVSAEPRTEYLYRITGYNTADGTSSSVEKRILLEATKTVFACADTYIYGNATATAYGKDAMAIVKYQGANIGKREVFLRFNLADFPERVLSASLKVNLSTASGDETGDEKLTVSIYPDFEWSDDTAPTWNSIYGGAAAQETELATWKTIPGQPLSAGDTISLDVSAAINKAKAAGQAHMTLHLYAYDPQSAWNFGLVTHERTQGLSIAPRIEFAIKNWVQRPFMLIMR